MRRIGLVVHPSRPIDGPLVAVRDWVDAHDAELVQLDGGTDAPSVAPAGTPAACDLVVAIGGDGTVLSALRLAAGTGATVLGVSCGSIGALTSVPANDVGAALDAAVAGTLDVRGLPALALTGEDGVLVTTAINDVVLVRKATAQLIVEVSVDGQLYARMAGDGVIVATALGSAAYTMAAGGPLVFGADTAYVCTPLAMHGGNAPPLVVPAGAELSLLAHPGYGGYELEVDGRRVEPTGTRYTVGLEPDHVALAGTTGEELGGLRVRGLIADSPRVAARDRRGPAVF